MTRSHRNEDRGGEHRWAFNGVEYPTRKLMCEARRAEYVRLLDEEGMNFTQAAHAVGVSKRTGKAWRNGRTRATGRNEKPLVDWYRSTMDKPKTLHPRYLSQEERIQIADRLRLGDSIRAIARLLGRDREKLQQQLQNMEQEKQRKLLYLADLGKITRKKENIQCTLDEIFWKMSEVQRMCKTVQDATSTLVADSSHSK